MAALADFPPRDKLNVGQWLGVSGAAFSTGIGRETSLGMSLLMGAANVRLGMWWESGLGTPGNGTIPFLPGRRHASDRLMRMAGSIFKTQRYLSYEFRARFYGTKRVWQYLSDGGHFENTAIYELLRSSRQIQQIFACDNGADPQYDFGDLGNLIRLAKIDLGIEITLADPASVRGDAQLRKVFGTPEDFGRCAGETNSRPCQDDADTASPCALLLYARRPDNSCIQIILIKPQLIADAPADVRQYAKTHPRFPQEPTIDQFFDEAQWESYRALGYDQARRIFNGAVLTALEAHRGKYVVPAAKSVIRL
ncbi:MAG: hypothetical protein QM742_06580 [Aquabacterium sp.]